VNRLVEFIALGKESLSPFSFFFDSEKTDDNVKFYKITNAEHPTIRVFALAPGYLPTRIAYETGTINERGEGGAGFTLDTLALPAATMLHLTSGRLDWLSGRFVHFDPSAVTASSCCCFSNVMRFVGFIPQIGIWRKWSGTGRT
jgi:hypothetical protein